MGANCDLVPRWTSCEMRAVSTRTGRLRAARMFVKRFVQKVRAKVSHWLNFFFEV